MSSHELPINEYFVWDEATYNVSGRSVAADATPRFYFFEENLDTPILEGLYTARASIGALGSWVGMYVGSGHLSTGNGFEVGKFYTVYSSGRVDGVTAFNPKHNLFILPQYQEVNMVQETGTNIERHYWADIKYTKDNGSNPKQDEFTVFWFGDNLPLPSGQAPGTTWIQVIRRTNGTALISTTAMTNAAFGTNMVYKHNETTNRLDYGEAYIAHISGVVAGKTREWFKVIYKDSGNV